MEKTMLVSRRVGVFSMCAQSPFQTGITDCRHEQRPRLVVDCGLDHHMTHPRELKSLVKQIEWAYVANLRAPRPFHLFLTGLETRSRIHQSLTNHIRDFNNYQIEVTDRPYDAVFSPQDIVYLSPDAEQDLEEIEGSKVYVMGGIVDLSIIKNLTLHRARVAGLRTARLPITRFMEFSTPSPHSLNLPLNIVTGMLLDRYCGDDWPQVLLRHMPKRKGLRIKLPHSS